MGKLKLVAPNVEIQKLWQSQYPGVEVLLSQKLPTTKPQSQKITCPNCDHQFAWGDAQVSEEQRAIYELHQHGHSIRAIGRMFKLAPESVRYRLKELQRNKFVTPSKELDTTRKSE